MNLHIKGNSSNSRTRHIEMTEIFIREASSADAPVVANFIRLMLKEMALMGGHRITESDEEWKRFEELTEERLNNKDCVYLLAHAAEPTPHSIGVVEALRLLCRQGGDYLWGRISHWRNRSASKVHSL
jgi:hypothetical protein